MAFVKTAEPRPQFFSSYLRTAVLMGALIALLAIGGREGGEDTAIVSVSTSAICSG